MSEEQSNPQENQSQNQGQAQFNPQNQFPPQNGGFGYGMQQALPNATAVLVLGILSIVTCCCYGIVGVILGAIAMVLAGKDKKAYNLNPAIYTESSFKNLNAGRICALVGLILSAIYFILNIIIIAIYGFGVMSDPESIKELLNGLQ